MAVDEGPFQNIVNVHWSDTEFRVIVAGNVFNFVMSLFPSNESAIAKVNEHGAAYLQAQWRGKTSGAVMDFSALPDTPSLASLSADLDVYPNCNDALISGWTTLSGGTPPSTGPFLVYSIAPSTLMDEVRVIRGLSRGSQVSDEDLEVCIPQPDAPLVATFAADEEVERVEPFVPA